LGCTGQVGCEDSEVSRRGGSGLEHPAGPDRIKDIQVEVRGCLPLRLKRVARMGQRAVLETRTVVLTLRTYSADGGIKRRQKQQKAVDKYSALAAQAKTPRRRGTRVFLCAELLSLGN
jgi:RecJ-like exonuclease